MASQPKGTPEVAGLFREIDKDNNGTLNEKELTQALQELGLPSGKEYVGELMRQYDADGNGSVDLREFTAYVSRKEAVVREAFRALDADGSGGVTHDELLKAMRKLGLPVETEDARRMVDLLDFDNNQRVTFDEFRRFAVLLPEKQLQRDSILVSWIDSADWMDGVEYRLCMTPPKHPLQRLVAGGLAGLVSRTTVAPLERLRTMMMADANNKSIRSTALHMWQDGGLRGLFKGNGATVMKVVPQCAIQMSVYDGVKDLMLRRSGGGKELGNLQRLTAGFVAGAACTSVVYPMENLRTHVSLGRKGSYAVIMREIVQSRGVRGLYQGFGTTMANTVMTTGLGLTSYEIGADAFRHFSGGRPPTPGERGWIAGCSAIGVMAATMPLEVVSRRMQIQGSPGHPVRYSGMFDAFRKIRMEEGVKALYRGTLSSFMKVAPSIGIVRYMYEALIQLGGIEGIRRFRSPPDTKSLSTVA